jgi:hypothetical protein
VRLLDALPLRSVWAGALLPRGLRMGLPPPAPLGPAGPAERAASSVATEKGDHVDGRLDIAAAKIR